MEQVDDALRGGFGTGGLGDRRAHEVQGVAVHRRALFRDGMAH